MEVEGRVLLRHPAQRRTHLVLVRLALRHDRRRERRLREIDRREDDRVRAVRQRVARAGRLQLATAPMSPAPISARRLLRLPRSM